MEIRAGPHGLIFLQKKKCGRNFIAEKGETE